MGNYSREALSSLEEEDLAKACSCSCIPKECLGLACKGTLTLIHIYTEVGNHDAEEALGVAGNNLEGEPSGSLPSSSLFFTVLDL